jgi:hypothetical protein
LYNYRSLEFQGVFKGIEEIIRKRNLGILELDFLNNSALQDIIKVLEQKDCCSLTELKLGCTQTPTELFNVIRKNKGLKVLELSEMSINSTPLYHYLGNSLFKLVDSRNLKELKLDGCGFLSNLLPKNVDLINLTKMVIVPSSSVASIISNDTDCEISEIVSNMPNLKSLIIPIISDLPLIVLSNHCLELEELDVIDGKNISDQGLLALTKLNHLKKLALGSAIHVTNTSMLEIIRNGRDLSRISLPFSNRYLDSKILPCIIEHCPRLEAITNLPAQITFEELKDFSQSMDYLVILGRCIGESRAFSKNGYLNKLQIDSIKNNSKKLCHFIQNG